MERCYAFVLHNTHEPAIKPALNGNNSSNPKWIPFNARDTPAFVEFSCHSSTTGILNVMFSHHSRRIITGVALRRLQSFVARFDPTAPLSTSEAQKLLISLTHSFQAHLDSRHPSIDKSSRKSLEMHLDSILSGPHFNKGSVYHIPNAAKFGKVSEAEYKIQLQQSTDPPMIHFRKCVSTGTATQELATACLEAEYIKNRCLSLVDLREQFKSSGTSTTVLNWLRSSSQGGGLLFLKNARLRKRLLFFMIAEGKEHLIWEWLQELGNNSVIHSRSPNDQLVIRNIQTDMVKNIIAFETKCGGNRESLIQSFSQNVQKTFLVGGNSVIDELIGWLVQFLGRTGRFQLSALKSLSRIISEWDTDPHYRCALVNLYKTQQASGPSLSLRGPDLAPTLRLLRQYPMVTILADSDRRRQDLIWLSLRLVELLARDGSDAAMRSATWVMGFLQAHFKAENYHEDRRKREWHSLKLLDSLSEM